MSSQLLSSMSKFNLESLEIFNLSLDGKWQALRHENVRALFENNGNFRLRFISTSKQTSAEASSDPDQTLFVLDLESFQLKIVMDGSICYARWGPTPPGSFSNFNITLYSTSYTK